MRARLQAVKRESGDVAPAPRRKHTCAAMVRDCERWGGQTPPLAAGMALDVQGGYRAADAPSAAHAALRSAAYGPRHAKPTLSLPERLSAEGLASARPPPPRPCPPPGRASSKEWRRIAIHSPRRLVFLFFLTAWLATCGRIAHGPSRRPRSTLAQGGCQGLAWRRLKVRGRSRRAQAPRCGRPAQAARAKVVQRRSEAVRGGAARDAGGGVPEPAP